MSAEVLEAVRTNTLEAQEFLKHARTLVQSERGCEALYDGARGKTKIIVRADVSSEDMLHWKQALGRAAAVAVEQSKGDAVAPAGLLAVRLRTLCDLIEDSRVFEEHYSTGKLRDQPHYRATLDLLAASGGEIPRDRIVQDLRLTQSNATRVLNILEQARLIARRPVNNKVFVRITGAGRSALTQWHNLDDQPQKSRLVALTFERVRGVEKNRYDAGRPRVRPKGSRRVLPREARLAAQANQ